MMCVQGIKINTQPGGTLGLDSLGEHSLGPETQKKSKQAEGKEEKAWKE